MQVKGPHATSSDDAVKREQSMASCSREDIYRHLAIEFGVLKKQLEQLAVAMDQAARTEGAEAMKAVSEKAQDLLSRATLLVDELAKYADKGMSAARQGRRDLEDKVHNQPLLALGIAAAAGFLLGSLRRR
jgi:ElaB/YqjD/DUF883 family membrane-anchored ribosome-binding protein